MTTNPPPTDYRERAMAALWPLTHRSVKYDQLQPTHRVSVDRVVTLAYEAFGEGMASIVTPPKPTVEDEVVEAPKDRRWLVSVRTGDNYRSVEVVAPHYMVFEGDLLFGTISGDCMSPDVATFAAGRWDCVVRQPAEDSQNPVVR